MKGFKDFLMRGNLIELAVAFILGGAFSTVVKSFTTIIMDLIGKLGGTPNFSGWGSRRGPRRCLHHRRHLLLRHVLRHLFRAH